MERKLSWKQICEIRKKYANHKYDTSMRKLAKEYGVSKTLVYKIIHYKLYKPENYVE